MRDELIVNPGYRPKKNHAAAARENGIFGSLARGIGRSVGGSVKRRRALGRAKRAYGKEVQLSSKLEATRARRQVAERALQIRRQETAARKADEKREKQERAREEKQLRAEQERERKAEERERKAEEREAAKAEAARRRELLDEQKARARESKIEERERRAIAAAEDRERKSYAGRMRRRPTYTQTGDEEWGYANPSRPRRARRTRSKIDEIGELNIAGISVFDVVGVGGGVALSRIAACALPLGAPGGWPEITCQVLLAYGLHKFAPETVRAGAVAGALTVPLASVLNKFRASPVARPALPETAAGAAAIQSARLTGVT